MRLFTAIVGFMLVVSLCDAAVVQRRAYRNTEEILVPVAIIQDGEEIKESLDLKENETVPQVTNLASEAIAHDLASAVDEEQKLEVIKAVVEAERRIDEAIVEEEIKEAVREEQDKEIVKAIEEEKKLGTSVLEEPQIVTVIQPEASQELEEPVEVVLEGEKVLNLKSVVVERETPNRVVVVVETNNNEVEQPEGTVRQATQATPTQTTTQQNFVQQLIQNSPLGQFFNQITGQSTAAQSQESNDEVVSTSPAPALPGLFNPVTAVQNAAQSVVNSTTQAFQGIQQFASNLGNQFQNTLSGLGGQQQGANDVTTARPPGPIQQLVNTFIGNTQQAQPASTPQGPLQGLFNIFQGNRPQGAAATANGQPQPTKKPEAQEQPQAASADADAAATAAATAAAAATVAAIAAAPAVNTADQISNEVRDSVEVNDSFEDIVQPDELIVVSDDASQTENDQEQEVENIFK